MREMPDQKLDARVMRVWRICDAVVVLLAAACVVACTVPVLAALQIGAAARTLLGAELACAAVALVVVLAVLPRIRYARWRYRVSPEFLEIAKGIIWRRRYVIPFIRVQNTDTRQGPVMRAFGLASVTVATAAEEHEIPGLDLGVAEDLRDRAAELARLAREDV